MTHITVGRWGKNLAVREWRAAYAGAYDWGPDVGRERVEE